MKCVVVYDSWTGNTEKIAGAISGFLNCDIFKTDSAPIDLSAYDILFLGSPNIRAKVSDKIDNFIEKAVLPKKIVLFITYGAPVWGAASSLVCSRNIKDKLEGRPASLISFFMCPGFHSKFKTYKGRPSEKDIEGLRAYLKRLNLLQTH